MFIALVIFLSVSILGSFLSMVITAANRDYSDGQKVLSIFLSMCWIVFALILIFGLALKW
jgi:hypothetical protein